ncbi:MAG: tRNA (adenosine(37)-N6)-threonylcarbamoyltransferase complex transferase subunit TsaD [Thermomicrobiales bacterium]
MNVLGIETSCDETAAAVVVDGRRVLSNVVASQIAVHGAHGGVVPELAARGHVAAIIPTVEAALAEAGVDRSRLDAVAVTAGPGLAGSLLVGVNAAKALAYALDRPLLPINHLEGHIYANWLTPSAEGEPAPPRFPVLCLLVSGGHTELILMTDHGRYRHLGRTLDDAAGEAFDKGARLLGLGYPGGPAIQRAAEGGASSSVEFPRAWLGGSDDFSFSGLKTALLRRTEPYREEAAAPPPPRPGEFAKHTPRVYRDGMPVADLAASYQQAVVDVLATKAARAALAHGAATLALAGGVAANTALRRAIDREMGRLDPDRTVDVRFPALEYCTDNAAMIAGAEFFAAGRGGDGRWDGDIHPRLHLGDGKWTNG